MAARRGAEAGRGENAALTAARGSCSKRTLRRSMRLLQPRRSDDAPRASDQLSSLLHISKRRPDTRGRSPFYRIDLTALATSGSRRTILNERNSVTKFTDLGLAEILLRALSREGYETPTSIQAQAIPHLLEGRDLLGIAQTGTGKTAAFALPILERLVADRRRPAPFTARAGARPDA